MARSLNNSRMRETTFPSASNKK